MILFWRKRSLVARDEDRSSTIDNFSGLCYVYITFRTSTKLENIMLQSGSIVKIARKGAQDRYGIVQGKSKFPKGCFFVSIFSTDKVAVALNAIHQDKTTLKDYLVTYIASPYIHDIEVMPTFDPLRPIESLALYYILSASCFNGDGTEELLERIISLIGDADVLDFISKSQTQNAKSYHGHVTARIEELTTK